MGTTTLELKLNSVVIEPQEADWAPRGIRALQRPRLRPRLPVIDKLAPPFVCSQW
jgi:hypothetical protein